LSYIGKTPTPAPLTSSDITDGIISTDKLADTSVTNAKLNADLISAETELATAPADTDELLISDAGVLKRIDASLVGGGGITMADQWRITASFTGDANPISSNWEQIDVASRLQGTLGSAMTQSSGIFTFPETGIYLVTFNGNFSQNGDDRSIAVYVETTTDNSSYATTSFAVAFIQQTTSNWTGSSLNTSVLVDVQDTANDKIRFRVDSQNNATVDGSTNETVTGATFIRLGDT